MRKRMISKALAKRFVQAGLKLRMSAEQRRAYEANADLQQLVNDAVDEWHAGFGDEPIDWATFFAELLKFIQGLMEILGPLIIPPSPTV